jgi:hypothetical protein
VVGRLKDVPQLIVDVVAVDNGQEQGRESTFCGKFYRQYRRFATLPRERITNRKTRNQIYANSMPSSSTAASVASGVKSEDKCAPASNMRPEIKAQNISATETENA